MSERYRRMNPPAWTGKLIGKMHNAGVTYDEIAEDMGVGKAYICMILNGRRTPPNAEERLYEAFDNALKKREGSA